METTDTAKRENEDETKEERLAATVAPKTEGKPFVLLQVNCRSIYSGNLIDTHNPYVIIRTESWLSVEISNAETFRDNYTIFRRDRHAVLGFLFV